ncbi:MAG: hypothetical protein R6V19_14730 [Armatimonadota bacterium]
MEKLLTVLLILTFAGALFADGGLPDGYHRSDEPFIGPVETPVMEQVFWVQIPVEATGETEASAPEGVRLLDQSKPGWNRPYTRLYFRSDRGIENGNIVVTSGDRTWTVPLTVRTYREDLQQQMQRVPNTDYSARKRGRSFYTDERIEIAQQNMEKYPELAGSVTVSTEGSDEETWGYIPSWNVPRQCYSNWECPHCGEEIFKKSGFYPWQRTGERFKCTCPVCDRAFPTNDFANDDFTSGEYPDDGWGSDPGGGERENVHAWVAHWNHHQIWKGGNLLRKLGLRYLLMDDEKAAHKAALLLARIAYVYPGLNYRWQQPRAKRLGRSGRALVDGNWERNTFIIPALKAYDAIYDAIDDDEALVEFLHEKDPTIESADDVKELIETHFVQLVGWDWLRRELSGGNQGAREEDLAEFIVLADMPEVTDRWLQELFTHAYNSGLNRGGFDDYALVNGLTRNGTTLVSGLGYELGYLNSKSDMAEILSHVEHPEWQDRCDLYDAEEYPKFRAEYDAWIDMLCAGQFGPQYGDSGGGRAARYPDGIPARYQKAYDRAYRRWRNDKLARAIFRGGKHAPELFEPDTWPDVKAHAERIGPAEPLQSRVLDGEGFAILESRPEAENVNDRAAIALRYGYALGHHHEDNLNIEMWAHGDVVSPELGYPCWAHPMGNTGYVAHHNTGMIDRDQQYTSGIGKGTLETFAGAPEASFADVSAEPDGFPNRVYRRAVCLADAPGGNVYLFDVLRMAGGSIRTYCFHGPGYDEFESSLEFGPVQEGPWDIKHIGRGLEINIVNPQNAATDGDVRADWSCDNNDMMVQLELLGETGRRYVTAECAKTDIPPLRYLFAEEEQADGASEFVGIWQPYLREPFVQSIERLEVTADTEGEFEPLAVRVNLKGGQTDTFIYTFDPQARLQVGDIDFQGSFGYWSERDGTPRCAHLVNGTRLTKSGIGIMDAIPSFSTTIASVNLETGAVTLEEPLPATDSLIGHLVYVTAGPHRTAFHIEQISEHGKTVHFKLHPIMYRSKIEKVAEDGSYLVAELPPRVADSGGETPHGYYDGALLTGEDLKARYRVAKTDDRKIYADRPLEEADFPDADGDGRRMVKLFDYGPGDRVSIKNATFVRFDKTAEATIADVNTTMPGLVDVGVR